MAVHFRHKSRPLYKTLWHYSSDNSSTVAGGIFLFWGRLLLPFNTDGLFMFWSRAFFWAAEEEKSILWPTSGCILVILPGKTQYAGSSVTVLVPQIRTVASTLNRRAATWLQVSTTPAIQVQWAASTFPVMLTVTHGCNAGSFSLWECSTWNTHRQSSFKDKNYEPRPT